METVLHHKQGSDYAIFALKGISLPFDRKGKHRTLHSSVFFFINSYMKFGQLLQLLEAKKDKPVPKIVKRLRSQLQAKGMNPGQAAAVANKTLQKSGVLKSGSMELTKKGSDRTAMGAAGRAKDRAAKRSGRSVKSYVYSKKTNRATLKKD